jgi:WD40 repeat protein
MVDFGVDRIEFSGDGRTLAVIGSDDAGGRALFLDAVSLDVRHELRRDDLHSSALSDDGSAFAVGSEDGSVALIDLRTGEERALLGRHDASVQGVAFSPDGSTLVSTGDDAAVNVWNLASGSLREILHGHAGRVTTAPVFDADGATAYTVGLDGNVIAWDLEGGRRIGRALPIGDGAFLGGVPGDGPPPTFDFVAAAPASGEVVATTTSDGSVIGVDPATGQVRWRADPWSDAQLERIRADDPAFADVLNGWVTEMAFDPNGDVLAVAGENPEVVLYDASTGRELARWRASRHGWVNGLSVAPDGSVVTANDDGRVVLWDATSLRIRHEFRFLPEPADMGAWSGAPFRAVVTPDGTRLAVAITRRGEPWQVTALEIASGERLWTQPGDKDVTIPAWSPDSRTLALGGWQNGSLTLRDADTGRRLLEPVTANAGWILSVAFTPDGSTIVTGGTDGTVRLWDSATLKQIGSNLPHDENIGTSAWVVRNDEIDVVSANGKLFRWDLDPGSWAEQACLVANRTLTRSEWRSFLPDLPYDPACTS